MDNIKKLLEKFYKGETSLAEDDQLREFFANEDIPEELEADKKIFDYYAYMKEEKLGDDFDEKILNKITQPVKLEDRRRSLQRIINIAAIIVAVVGIFVIQKYYNFNETPQKQYTQKQIADMKLTVDVLLKASKYMNKTNTELNKLETVNKAFEEINKVNYIEKYNKLLYKKLGVIS